MATEQERVPSGVLPVPPAPSSVLSPLVLLEPVSSISQGSDGACWGSFEAGGGASPNVVDFALLPRPPPAHNNSHRLPPSDSLAIIMYLHYSSLLLMYPRPLSITSGIPRKYP